MKKISAKSESAPKKTGSKTLSAKLIAQNESLVVGNKKLMNANEVDHLKLLESVVTHTFDAIVIYKAKSFNSLGAKIIYVNKAFTQMTGFAAAEVIGKSAAIFHGPKTDKAELKKMNEAIRKCEAFESTLINYKKNGELFWKKLMLNPVVDEINRVTHWVSIGVDITEEKKREENLKKSTRLYQFISHINQMVLHTKDERVLFKESCRIAIEIGGFKMAWIGETDQKTKMVIPVISYGFGLDYLKQLKVSGDNQSVLGKGVVGMALTSGRYSLSNDIATDPKMAPWKKEALKRGFLSCISFPINKFNQSIGTYTLYADLTNFFDIEEISLLEKVSADISFAVETIENENKRRLVEADFQRNTEQLQQLTSHLLTIREEERKRIGRELHDELGQQLTAIKMDIAWINKQTSEASSLIKNKLRNVIDLLDGSNSSLRRILNDLRPTILDEQGLLDALVWHGKQFTDNTGIPLEIITEEKEIKVPEKMATCFFRAFQEALTNITRYAEATKVVTSLRIYNGIINMTIRDNGKGFDIMAEQPKTRNTFGLLGMRERVRALEGKFELASIIGGGTTITIRLPLK